VYVVPFVTNTPFSFFLFNFLFFSLLPTYLRSLSFCSMTLIALYSLQKIALYLSISRSARTSKRSRFESIQIKFILLLAVALPMSIAFYVAASRVVDNWHHPADVICGSLIGIFCGMIGHFMFFPMISTITWKILYFKAWDIELVDGESWMCLWVLILELVWNWERRGWEGRTSFAFVVWERFR